MNAVWPGSSLHYIEAIRQPRYEDYEITYLGPAKKNRWAWLGMGSVRELVEKGDVSPYLTVDNIDPKWMRAMNINSDKVLESKVDRIKKEWAGKTTAEGDSEKNIEGTSVA